MREQLCSRVGNSRTVTHFTHIPCGAGVIVSRLVLLMLLSLKGMHRYRKQHRYQVRYIEIPVSVVQKKKKPIQRPRLQAQWMRRLHLNKCCVLIFAAQSRWRCVYRKAGDSVFNWNVLLVWKALLTFCSMDCVYYSECFVFFIYGFLVYLFNLCFIIYILCRRIVSVCHRITHFP